MGTVVSKSPKKNKIRHNAKLVGTLQVSAQRSSQHRSPRDVEASVVNQLRNNDEETKPISLVDPYEVNDSLLFNSRGAGNTTRGEDPVPYFKAWHTRVIISALYIYIYIYIYIYLLLLLLLLL